MQNFASILLTIPGVILAIVIRGFSRAYVSDKLGDPSPRIMGKLNLSPRSHIDPFGFFLLLLFHFGWSKPVFTDSRYYKNPRKGKILVALSGTIGNLLVAVISLALYKLLSTIIIPSSFLYPLVDILSFSVGINISLGLFYLIPLPPLDGFDILQVFVSYKYYRILEFLRQYGNIILLLLILTNLVGFILPYNLVYRLLNLLTYPLDLILLKLGKNLRI